ncbi:MAG: cobalamin-binding protein [Gammaproteobacteria bacterium]|nr:cobalamin-binding protein [Gammaproteobacteria bacterium]
MNVPFQNIKSSLVFFLVGSILTTSLHAAIGVKDDEGRRITLYQPANRIISLAPHITESLFAAGAGDKVIGAVSYSDYPEAAKKIPRVGGYPSLDVETILSLKPDLIVAWASGNNMKQVDKLAALGIPVFKSEPRYPLDIAKTIKHFGILAGTTEISTKASNEFIQHYMRLKKQYSNKTKIKVFYQFWNSPKMTINGKHLISKMINLCGGINVFAGLHSITPKVSVESVIATKTDVIIAGDKGENKSQWMSEWAPWVQVPAVKNEQIYFIDPDLLNRAGPRILQGADQLCELLEKVRKH